MRFSLKKLLLAFAASGVLAVLGSPVSAQTVFNLNFDDPNDPRLDRIVVRPLGGDTTEIREDGGIGDSGYLSITDAANGQNGLVIFPDFSDPPGTALESFKITAQLRVGAGTDRPADGFSFNLVRPDDPLIWDPDLEESRFFDEDGNPLDEPASIGQYAGIGTEGSLPEEGTRTGLSVGFDEWQSGGVAPEASAESCGDWEQYDPPEEADLPLGDRDFEAQAHFDCVGMSVRVDGILIEQIPFPVLNAPLPSDGPAAAEQYAASLQTGPQGDVEDLLWEELAIQLTPDRNNEGKSFLTVTYKGQDVVDANIDYTPSPGQLVFGGRTGGANGNHHIDDITIVTDFTRVLLGDFNGDEIINLADYAILVANMNTEDKEFADGDIDFNGRVNLGDFVTFRREFAKSGVAGAAVPEPGAGLLAVMALAGLTIVRRRRG